VNISSKSCGTQLAVEILPMSIILNSYLSFNPDIVSNLEIVLRQEVLLLRGLII